MHTLMQADYVLGYRQDKPTRCELPAWRRAESDVIRQPSNRQSAFVNGLRSLPRVPARRRAGGHRLRAHDGAGRPPQGRRGRGRGDAPRARRGPDRRDDRHRRRRARRSADALHRREGRSGECRERPRRRWVLRRSTSPSIRSKARTSVRTGAPGAIAVLAASEKGGLLHAPDLYMEKLIVPEPAPRHGRSRRAGRRQPACDRASRSSRDVDDLVIIVLDRPRHEKLIADIRATGARIKLIGDGDLSAAIVAAVAGTGVHAVMGTGGAPEGVLTAAAMRCLNGEIYARLVVRTPEDEARCHAMGITDLKRIYTAARSRARPSSHLRRHRRHRGRADEGRPLLPRRHAHGIARHADVASTDPLHRLHPRQPRPTTSRSASEASIADASAVHVRPRTPTRERSPDWRRNLAALVAAVFIGFTGFTLVMPFLPIYIQQMGETDVGAHRRVDGRVAGRDAGDDGTARAALGPPRRSLRPQGHGRCDRSPASSS